MAAAKIVAADPNVDGFMSAIGAGGSSSTLNQGRMFMRLKDRSERKLNANQIIQELRKKLAQVPGINVFMQNPPLIRVGGQSDQGACINTACRTPTRRSCFNWAPILMDKLAGRSRGFQDVTSDLQIASPQVNVEIDRDKAAALGVTPEQIENALYDAYRRNAGLHHLRRRGRILGRLRGRTAIPARSRALAQLYITSSFTSTNGMAEAGSLERRRQTHAQPRPDHHFARRPVAGRHHFLQPRARHVAGHRRRTVAESRKLTCTCRRPSPAAFKARRRSFNHRHRGCLLLLIVSIIVIYIILGILYESFIHPLTILSGLPSAGFGALLTLMLFHLD